MSLRDKLLLAACTVLLALWAGLAWYGLYKLIVGCPSWSAEIPSSLLP